MSIQDQYDVIAKHPIQPIEIDTDTDREPNKEDRLMEYRVQRPTSVWIETTVEANSFEEALELADEEFGSGNFTELDDTWETNWDRYWMEDENSETEEGY
jgi:hypothetical protein